MRVGGKSKKKINELMSDFYYLSAKKKDNKERKGSLYLSCFWIILSNSTRKYWKFLNCLQHWEICKREKNELMIATRRI